MWIDLGMATLPHAPQLAGKTKPQVTPAAFVYFGSYIKEKNVVSQVTLGTSG
jgi:hypothetical protein